VPAAYHHDIRVSGHYAPLLPQLPVEDAVYSPIPANGARKVDPTQIAVAQLAITVAEPDANRQAAADAVAEAAAMGAQLVVLPELCDSGYVFDAADPAAEARGLAAPAADSATLRQWQSWPPGTGW
jgi:Predicted amidohydrolase